MSSNNGKVVISISSTVDITLPDTSKLDIKSAKALGILALLAMSPDFSRPRSWMRDRLWSDRSRTQATASLRQEIYALKKKLGDYSEIFDGNSKDLALNPEEVAVTKPSKIDHTFLEGLDLGDTAFQGWRQDEIDRAIGIASHSLGVTPLKEIEAEVVIRTPRQDDGSMFAMDAAISGLLATGLRDLTDVKITEIPITKSIPTNACIDITSSDRHVHIVVTNSQRKTCWSHTEALIPGLEVTEQVDRPDTAGLVNQTIEAVCDLLRIRVGAVSQMSPSQLTLMAQHLIFSMKRENLEKAELLLQRASSIRPAGIHAAWRAQLRAIQYVEQMLEDEEQAKIDADQLCHRAMELDPTNSMVVAAVAKSRLVMENNIVACDTLARKSLTLNPTNPFAWDVLAAAKLYSGSYESAYQLSTLAQQLSRRSSFGFWWDMGRSVTSALSGRVDTAVSMAERASAQAGTFRAPLRYLTALYAAEGNEEAAVRAAKKLQNAEPDFTLERMALDDEYPVSPLRKSGLLNKEALVSLNSELTKNDDS